MSGVDDASQRRRNFKAPYTPHNPIPTIQQYREEKKEREGEDERTSKEKAQAAYRSWKDGDTNDEVYPTGESGQDVYPTDDVGDDDDDDDDDESHGSDDFDSADPNSSLHDTSEAVATNRNAKEQRKALKKRKGGEREVTDPVTHLPIKIHDFTDKDLKKTPENLPPPRTGTGLEDDELHDHDKQQRRSHRSMHNLFPPPEYDEVGQQMAQIQSTALTVGLASVLAIMVGILILEKLFGLGARLESKVLQRESAGKTVASIFLLVLASAVGSLTIWCVRTWTEKKVNQVWDRETWEAERQQGRERAKANTPESTQWLCELLSSVWPLVNPDLFTR
jgi:hypothetical protein